MNAIYIAGPMTGYEDFNYPAFNAAAHDLYALGHDVLNPVDLEHLNVTGKPQTWKWYIRHAIGMVARADGIALLPGWEQSKGAVLEHAIGVALDLDIRPLKEWLP